MRRLKKLGIAAQDEVSFSLDGTFCTTTIEKYISLLQQGRNVTMYHFTSGRADRCAAKYIRAIGELVDQENEAQESEDHDERTVGTQDQSGRE